VRSSDVLWLSAYFFFFIPECGKYISLSSSSLIIVVVVESAAVVEIYIPYSLLNLFNLTSFFCTNSINIKPDIDT
jgi:hypothetical protein